MVQHAQTMVPQSPVGGLLPAVRSQADEEVLGRPVQRNMQVPVTKEDVMRFRSRSICAIFALAGVLVVGGCQRDERDSRSEPSQTNTAQTRDTETKTTADKVSQSVLMSQRNPSGLLEPAPPKRPPQ